MKANEERKKLNLCDGDCNNCPMYSYDTTPAERKEIHEYPEWPGQREDREGDLTATGTLEYSTTLYFDESPCPVALWGSGLGSADDFFDWGPPERGQGCCGDCKFYSFLRGGCEHERGERDKNADCMNGKFERAKVE